LASSYYFDILSNWLTSTSNGIVMVSHTGDVFLIWDNVIVPSNDAGPRLQTWASAWKTEMVEMHWARPERFGWKYEA